MLMQCSGIARTTQTPMENTNPPKISPFSQTMYVDNTSQDYSGFGNLSASRILTPSKPRSQFIVEEGWKSATPNRNHLWPDVEQMSFRTRKQRRFEDVVLGPEPLKPTNLDRIFKREQRDEHQRNTTATKAVAQRKAEPKRARKDKIRDARDKRNPVSTYDVELQSGHKAVFGIITALFTTASVWRAGQSTSRIADSACIITQQLQSFKKSLMEQLGKALWSVPFVVVIHFAIQHFEIINNPICSVLVSVLAGFLGKSLWGAIAKFFPDCNNVFKRSPKVEWQAGIMDAAPKLLSTVMAFSIFGRKMTPSTITEFSKRISMIDRVATGWETFLRWTLESIETCINVVRERFGKSRTTMFSTVHRPTYDWAKSVDKACMEHSTAMVDPSPEELNKLVKLVTDGYGFKEVYRNTSMTRYVDEYVLKASNLLQPYLGALNASNNFRFEPMACMLYGGPGIGKTILAVPLCAAVLMESGLLPRGSQPVEVIRNIWQKGSSEFWNSYAAQLCVVLDDAFQQRTSVADKDNEYMNMIRMVGSWSYPLNFADLQSKGKIFFGSKFIFGTTNVSSFNSEAGIVIAEPHAVARRISFPYKLILKPEYALDGRLDKNKYDLETAKCREFNRGLDGFPWYIWEVARHDYITGETSTTTIPVKEMVSEIAAQLKHRAATFVETKDYLNSFILGLSEPEIVDPSICPDIPEMPNFNFDSVCNQGGGSSRPGLDPSIFTPISDDYAFSPMQRSSLLEEFEEIHGRKRKSYFKDFYQAFKDWSKSEWDLRTDAKVFLGCIGTGFFIGITYAIIEASLNALWRFIAGFFNKNKPEGNPEAQSNRPVTVRNRMKARDIVSVQSLDSQICTNVYSNTYKMFARMDVGETIVPFVIGQVCFIVDTMVLQPQHYTEIIKNMVFSGELGPKSFLEFRHAVKSEHMFTFSVNEYLSLPRVSQPGSDTEFVSFKDVRAHRNIESSFITEADVKYLSGVRGRLDICEVDDRKQLIEPAKRMVYTFPSMKYGEKLKVSNRVLDRYIVYNAPTTAGDCGAPLCLFDNSSFSGRTAIGIHVSGCTSRGLGYANIVTQEKLKAARLQLKIVKDSFATDLAKRGIELQSGTTFPFGGSFLEIGEVKPIHISPKSKMYPTKHFGKLGEFDKLPAPMSAVYREGELVYPMANAVAPYHTPLLIYEQEWLPQAMHVAMRNVTAMTKDCPRRIYSFEESILGIAQAKFRSIPRNTAAGFPYVYDVRDGKKEFFGYDQDYDLDTPRCKELWIRVCEIERAAKENERLSHVFIDFLKDELRTPAKIQAVATRLISSAPLDYTVIWRMYFGAFSTAVMSRHTVTGMAPGICCFTDWDMLANMLQKKGDKVFDGDFKSFDSSEQPTIHRLILNYINNWYNDGEDNCRVRSVLWLDLMHSRHLGGLGKDQKHIYQWNKSLPSGHPFTTIVNSMYSLFTLVAAYTSQTKDLTGFWDNVSVVTFGDDNVSNVSDSFSHLFNQVTVANTLKEEFNLTYTSGKKDGKMEPYTTLDDVTFLKRRITYSNMWNCPLELESFLYSCYWCSNRRFEEKTMISSLETALEELSMHTPEVWESYASQILEIMSEIGHVSKAVGDQGSYRLLVASRSDNWY